MRQENGLNESSILTVYQIEIYNPNEQSLINNVEYAVFNEEKQKLELSVCSNNPIEINYQINTSMLNISKINYYSELGVDIFNLKGDFFNDICYSYSEGDSDMVLEDRVTEIYQNFSVCESNCNYNKMNLQENTVSCKCWVKTEVTSDLKPLKLDKIIRDTFEDTNLAVIKCYNLVFRLKNKIQNIGFLIFSVLVFLHIPFFIYYSIYNISSLRTFIYSEMDKFHYYCYLKSPPKKSNKIPRSKSKKKSSNIIIPKKSSIEYLLERNIMKEKTSSRLNISKSKTKLMNDIMSPHNGNDEPSKLKSKSKSNMDINKRITIKRKSTKNKRKTSRDQSLLKQNPVLLVQYKVLNNNITLQRNNEHVSTQKGDKNDKKTKLKSSSNIYSLIQMDANDRSYISKPKNLNFILDYYDYEMAVKYDKRKFWKLLYICILAKENIINIIFFKTPLDLNPLRACLFIFSYSCDLAFNTIFYSKQNISDKYHYKGDNLLLFTMVNNLLQTLISLVVGLILVNVFQHMIDSRNKFEDIFKEEEQKMRKNENYIVTKENKLKIVEKIRKLSGCLRYKIVLFIILEFSIMLFFYYFVTAFCEVYKKTQNSWLYDFFTGFLISIGGEIAGAFLIAIFYIISLRYKIKFVYNMALFFYNL